MLQVGNALYTASNGANVLSGEMLSIQYEWDTVLVLNIKRHFALINPCNLFNLSFVARDSSKRIVKNYEDLRKGN
jgi:hypothetical protein